MPPSPAASKRPPGASATTSKQRSSNSKASTSKAPPPPDDDDAYSDSDVDEEDDDDDDEAANLEMDGQDLWTQNYCSVCDCLIEPGQGVGRREDESEKTSPTASSAATPTAPQSPGLVRNKANTGTIKGRPVKRNGSSNRLNALSDLKPTTKITGQKEVAPKMSRRTSNTSTASTRSANSSVNGGDSPQQLQRTRKGGLLGALTPAALRQQQEELLKANGPPALYCSERCRSIDEQQQQQISGQDLDLYSSQAGTMAGAYAEVGVLPTRPWPRTPSMTSLPAATAAAYLAAANRTPDSEYGPCMCPDCLDKTSASGTVPSGASDTTESSNGYPYSRRSTGKQRSQSGRLLTPRDLYPPVADHRDEDGYFPRAKPRTFSFESGERALSEEASTQSSGSYSSLWEPKLKRRGGEREGEHERSKPVDDATDAGAATAMPASPLRLLRHGNHRSSPLVDVAASSPGGTKLSFGTSMTSERTLGTSANTLVHPDNSNAAEGRHRKARSLAVILPDQQRQQEADSANAVDRLNAERLSKSYASGGEGADAMATLRAASRNSHHRPASHRHSFASTSSSTSASTTGWLRSLSSAWTSLRSASATNVPQLLLPADGNSAAPLQASPQGGSTSPGASSAVSSSRGSARSDPRSDDGSNLLSRSAASESLSRVLSGTHLSGTVARPGASRGSVPAFASEIGRGQIPGEAEAEREAQRAAREDGEEDEEARRRRRKAEHRHQRSKDVTVLPPLLAPRNRSSTTLSSHHRAHSYANLQNRNRSHSRGAKFVVGSAGSYREGHTATPPTPTSATDEQRPRSPLPRVASHQDVHRPSMSPRRSTGLGAMTPITAAPPPRSGHPHHAHRPSVASRNSHHRLSAGSGGGSGSGAHLLGHVGMLGHHPHGSQAVYGRHNTMPVRTSTPIVPEHGGEMTAEALTATVTDPLVRPSSAMSQRHLRGNHIARPRSTAPMLARLPSGAPLSARLPAAEPQANAPHRGWSYDNLARAAGGNGSGDVKTYPVLQVPHREETHDRYDDAWGSNAMELIGGPELAKQRRDSLAAAASQASISELNNSGGAGGGEGAAIKRKQLFHFGA